MAAVTSGRTALVVGGSSGIGAACVEGLAEAGWSVLVADLRPPSPDAPVAAAEEVDVRDADAVDLAVDRLAGDKPIDGLVYAAGIGHVAPFADITPARWRLVMDVNLTGAFHAARAVIRHMPAGGSLVLISSIDSTAPVSGLAHYCASKAGVDALSRSLALELGPRGIRSNVVAPGPVRTPLMDDFFADPATEDAFVRRVPLGAIAVPEQIASTVTFLLSEAAGHITGARIPIDGGMSLREHPSMLHTPERTP
jgi:NAD(P)-dependent dehydrogenase (short-subunit alcohol dehydrogenase family)